MFGNLLSGKSAMMMMPIFTKMKLPMTTKYQATNQKIPKVLVTEVTAIVRLKS